MAKANQKPGEKAYRLLIVAHGDLDGIISAVLVARRFGPDFDQYRVCFVQPFTVGKVDIADDEKVVVVDVAVNNRDPQMTIDFLDRLLGDRLLWRWYDHHQGWELDLGRYGRIGFLDHCATTVTHGQNTLFKISECRSCASLILEGERNLTSEEASLVADATAADTRRGQLSERADLIERATKANLSDDSVREAAFWGLLGDESRLPVLEAAAEKYAAIQAETERLSATYRVTGNVALVDARKSNHQYDLTQLLLAGQKEALFAVAQTVNPSSEEGLTIATSKKDVSLVELFGLGSGASFRVSISAERLEEILEKLNAI